MTLYDFFSGMVVAGFLLSVDQSVSEFLHAVLLHASAADTGEDRRVRLARDAMMMARTKHTSD